MPLRAPALFLRCRFCTAFVALTCVLAVGARAADDLSRPLKASADGHFLAQPDGEPFFWLADTAWDFFQRLDRDEANDYLRDRAAKGFTVIQAVVGGAGSHQGLNRYGEAPFMDDDPTHPNERYFAHVDWITERARGYGLRMAVLPYWAGAFQNRSAPVGAPLRPPRVVFNPENAEIYGRWLGRRYRNKGVSWIFGGDANPLWPNILRFRSDNTGRATLAIEESDMRAHDWHPVYDAFATGLAEGERRPPFISYHPSCCTFRDMPRPLTSIYFGGRTWLVMNMIQSSHYEHRPEEVHGAQSGFSFGWVGPENYEPIAMEFASTPTRPVIDGEPRYEDLGKDNDAKRVRQKGYWAGDDARNAAYHAVFAGAAGHTYGNHAVWQFAGTPGYTTDPPLTPELTWREALQRPVSGQLRQLKALMLSRPYFTRTPDQSVIVGSLGEGTAHVSATRDRTGSYLMIYLPEGEPVTVNLNNISGSTAVGWWFDPRTGQSTRIENNIPTNRPWRFTPPSAGRGKDWVLVLDDASQKFGVPGKPSPP